MADRESSFSIFVHGQDQHFTQAEAKVKFFTLATEFKAADAALATAMDAHLAKAIVLGAFVLQLQQHLPLERIVAWSKDDKLKLGHVNKLYAAIGLARHYASEKGVLDEERLVDAIRAFNATCVRLGLRPLDEKSRSIRTAEIAAGMRPGSRDTRASMVIPSSGEKSLPGAPGGEISPDSGNDDDETSAPDLEQIFAIATGSGWSGGGTQTAKPAGMVPAALPAATAADRDLEASGVNPRSPRPMTSAESGTTAVRAAIAKASTPKEVQLMLEDAYREAADEARSFARMLDAQAVEPELMERFRALAKEARAKRPGGW